MSGVPALAPFGPVMASYVSSTGALSRYCRMCGEPFTLAASEVTHYRERLRLSLPRRCVRCRREARVRLLGWRPALTT